MEKEMIYVPVQSSDDPFLEQIEKTYTDSFPPTERRDFHLVRKLIDNPFFKAYAVLKEEKYVGFITIWEFESFIYVEHFAIDASARNSGIGGKILQQFLENSNKPVVLEVELPEDEMSKRRVGFYERLGFTLDDHLYQQPPYREGDSWLDMRFMTCGNINLSENFETVKNTIYKHVYGRV